MNPFRLIIAIAAACCMLRQGVAVADDSAPPFTMEKQYSADIGIMTKEGMAIQSRTYVDGDKMRSDVALNGMQMATIVRKDKLKVYQILVAQKIVMETDYDPSKFKGQSAASFGPEGKFELVGPDTIDGIACTKYKVTSDKTKQVFDFWLNVALKAPVQMAAEDGSFTVKWTNFKVGPQDATLFEPPAGYQIMPLPNLPGAAAPKATSSP